MTRGLSSAGRASALQAEGHRFEPYRPHFRKTITYGEMAQLARASGSYPGGSEFKSRSRYSISFGSFGPEDFLCELLIFMKILPIYILKTNEY